MTGCVLAEIDRAPRWECSGCPTDWCDEARSARMFDGEVIRVQGPRSAAERAETQRGTVRGQGHREGRGR